MKKVQFFRNLCSALIVTFLSSAVQAQVVKRLDSVAKIYHLKGFNGNVLYSKDNTILFTGNYGYRNFESEKFLNDSTLFELASVSKQFTALAIVQLEEKGQLKYHTKVSKLIEPFPYKNITVEHLLRHQSGLPDYQKLLYNRKNWNRKKVAKNSDVLRLLSQLKLDLNFEAGTQYDYNNTGYVVLALIIEALSKQTYADYIKQHIFIPAEMTNSVVSTPENNFNIATNYANGYTFNKRKRTYQPVEKDKNHKHIHWMNDIVAIEVFIHRY